MLSKATPLLLTASPKITLNWSAGLLCIHFPYSLYPIQSTNEVHTCSKLVLGQQFNRWTHKFSVLNKHFWHCRTYCREMNAATIRSSFLHTGEREGEFLHILHKLDTLFVPTTLGDNHSFPLCINSCFDFLW